MCDTVVVVPPPSAGGGVWLAKNSDREPGEAQIVEHHPRAAHPAGARLPATWIEIDQARATNEVVLSRPAWMWGAEMGVSERGVAIGNEAVFTRVPVAESGLTGMDLLRLALERGTDAGDALERIVDAIARHGQGGRCGYRARGFRYHNAFVIADAAAAWVLETAGPYWAAERVAGVRTASNVLSIGPGASRVGPGTIEAARRHGWLRPGEDFDFRACFGAPVMSALSGGDVRRACTARSLAGDPAAVGLAELARVLRDHAGRTPQQGSRLVMPCAHASWQPTRHAGQTTGSMIASLGEGAPRAWLTGTSSPCLSVLKPVPLGGAPVSTGPAPASAGADRESLFWRHERLHRTVLRDYDARRAAFEDARADLESRALGAAGAEGATAIWAEHRERVLDWTARARQIAPARRPRPFDAYWALQSWRDGISG